ncbi:putative receptor-like protein kinase At1g72540 [Lactuca sativa]|uniref:putative receptor-like protein kinase At1g72540 n=1 Tax=Lactuca sativa TaxID=4236 RepID=UPI0022AE7852|nr:putative receptor-like protein kinase At1g72540 [Lactuca sativa]
MSGRVFFYAELKAATKEFNCRNFLGQGGSCCKTAGPERRVEAGQGIKEFDTEIVMLGRLRHPNLVSLVGYCQHEDERLLVYEYMSGGRLGEHNFGSCCKTAGPERRGEAGLGIKEFDTEIVMMGRLRHPNLVSLVQNNETEFSSDINVTLTL